MVFVGKVEQDNVNNVTYRGQGKVMEGRWDARRVLISLHMTGGVRCVV